MEGWEYQTDIEGGQLDRGYWVSEKGMVRLVRPEMEYAAWVFIKGKKYRIKDASESGMFVSAAAGMETVERVWKKETDKL